MKIHSSFKDYYDHIGNMYGGGDPNVLYLRKPFDPDHIPGNVMENLRESFYTNYTYFNGYKTAWLCVNAHYYLCLGKVFNETYGYDWVVFSEKNFPEIWEKVSEEEKRYKGSLIYTRRGTGHYCGAFDKDLLKVSRDLKAPVFMITSYIMKNIPKLGEMGFATVKTPEQMYQETAYFVGNLMHESPDLAKPSIMDDKQKIQSHGFDLKQSFRHRK